MSRSSLHVVDEQGVTGVLQTPPDAGEASVVQVALEDGQRLRVARDRLVPQGEKDGYRFAGAFEEAGGEEAAREVEKEVRVSLAREEAHVRKEERETGRVRIHKHVVEDTEEVDVPLLREEVDVERVPVERVLEEPAETRQEGDTLIIPLMEEQLVVKKQWVLKEELHVRRHRREEREQRTVTLRRQEADVERLDAESTEPPTSPEDRATTQAE